MTFVKNLAHLASSSTQEANSRSKIGNFSEFRPISIGGKLSKLAKTKLEQDKKRKTVTTSKHLHNNVKSWRTYIDESQRIASPARQIKSNTLSLQAKSPLTRRFYFAFNQTKHASQKAHLLEVYFRTLKKGGELGALQSCSVSHAMTVRFSDLNIQPIINLLTSKKYFQEDLQDNFHSRSYYQYSSFYTPDQREMHSIAITRNNFEIVSTLGSFPQRNHSTQVT